MVKAIEGEQLVLSGMQEGGYDLPALKEITVTDSSSGAVTATAAFNVQTAIDSSNRIMVRILPRIPFDGLSRLKL